MTAVDAAHRRRGAARGRHAAHARRARDVGARAARARSAVAFVGGGTELGWGGARAAGRRAPHGALDRVVEHAPGDQIVTVECGHARWPRCDRLLAEHGQMLALDPPWARARHVGGVVATNAFGARRTRYGAAARPDHRRAFVRADGTPARAGGKVVKNVAGFDLPKLLTGSLGTLGLDRDRDLPAASAARDHRDAYCCARAPARRRRRRCAMLDRAPLVPARVGAARARRGGGADSAARAAALASIARPC